MSPLTDSQRHVVTHLDANFCVTSGAGCGKTRVLVERYMHVLEQKPDVPLSALAAITFTEKAAAQMRDRIRAACRDHIAAARLDRDAVRLGRWRQRYWDVDIAPINTIHGFCGSLLRQWPIEAGVDPQFTTLDETAATFLRQDVVAATLERLLEAEDADLLAVLEHLRLAEARSVLDDCLSGRREVLRRVAGPVMAMTDEAILARVQKRVDEIVLARLRGIAESPALREAEAALARVAGEEEDKLEAIRRRALDQLNRLRGARTAQIARAAAADLVGAVNLRCGSAKRWPSEETLEAAKDGLKALREPLKAALDDLPVFEETREREHLALARALYRTMGRVLESYEAAKRERSALDFEDLQIRARDLLRDHPRVRDACRRRFRAVLVDELQDTNFLQFEIVDLLTTEPGAAGQGGPLRPGALFAVGDPKQSIYRFRGAEVEVFERALGRVPEAGRRGLEQSFRLHPGTAALVNQVFAPLMGEAYEPVRGAAPQANETVAEVLHVVNPDGETGYRAAEGITAEARTLAARLSRIVSRGEVQVTDGPSGSARPVGWGDIALLLRRTTHLHLYEEALEAEGVPYYVVAGRGFYKQQEVLDVVHLLRVLQDPADDLPLAGVLRSPFFAVSDEGLFRLKRLAPTLHEGLERIGEAETLDPDDRRGLERAARLLPRWAAMKDRLGLARLVETVAFESGYAAGAVGRFGGARAYANLRQMVDLARQFERGGLWALGDFVEYVTDVMQNEMRAEQAPVEAPGTDAVRIMTIHKAKGLEFPVVVLPDLAQAASGRRRAWDIHPASGLAVRMRDDDSDRPTSAALALAHQEEADALEAESHRLFYVATTRAKDYLIFSAHQPYRTPRGRPWLADLLTGLGAAGTLLRHGSVRTGRAGKSAPALGTAAEVGKQVVPLASGGSVLVHVRRPPASRGTHGRRRRGPQDIFADGRVRWDRIRERAGRARSRGEAAVAQVRLLCQLLPTDNDSSAVGRLAHRAVPTTGHRATAFVDDGEVDKVAVSGAAAAAGPPPSIPATALAEYRRCPRRYWWKQVLGLDATGPSRRGELSAAEWGTLCHRAIEAAEEPSEAAITSAVETALRETDAPAADREGLRRRLLETVRGFWHGPLGPRVAAARRVFREMPFAMTLAETEVHGTMDLLLEEPPGTWEVVDYKTGPPPEPGDALQDAYALQLGLYAAAAGRWLGRPPARWGIYYLERDVYQPHDVTGQDLDRTVRDAEEILARLAIKRYDSINESACRTCDVRTVCRADS